jgi:hypothetical protein
MKEIKQREVTPLAIVGAAIVVVLFLGVLWYHFLGPGTGSGLPTKSAHEMPLSQVPPNIRAMFEPKGGGRGAEPLTPR